MKYSEYNEKKQHGSADFPIELYKVDRVHPQYVMPLHWHKEMEIIRILAGDFSLYINNVQYLLHPGDVAFVNCGQLHRGDPLSCRYECAVFDLTMLFKKSNAVFSNYITPILLGKLLVHPILHPSDSELYRTVNDLFVQLDNASEYYELGTVAILFSLLDKLYRAGCIEQNNSTEKASARTGIIHDLIQWIDDNHTEHITLQTLSEKAGVSANYLCRVFKEYTGKTPIEYVNSIRIENICYEIKWGQKNITEAAIAGGYNDLSYFCKVFKKHKGISAKAYAKKIQS